MAYTTLTQRRYSVNPTIDTIKYRIETTIISAGELPRIDIFVYQIVDSEDPSTDLFVHVASLAELQSLKDERDTAILNNEAYYMSPYVELDYDDLETAIAAAPTINSRINDLVLAWIDYNNDFVTNGDYSYSFPVTTDSELEARKTAYTETKEEVTILEEEVVTTTEALETAELTLEHNQEILDIYTAQKEFCTSVVNNKYPTYIALVLAGNGEDTATYSYRTGTGSLEQSMNEYCSTLTSNILTWTNTVAANQSTVNTARGEKIAAEVALDKAEQRASEALASVLEICPDLDPSTL